MESGGVETGTVDLALSLKQLGHTVTVISNGGRLVRALEDNGIEHICLPVHIKSPHSLFLVPKIANILRLKKIDIVHASSRVPAWIGYLTCKLAGVKFVTSCHGFYSTHFFSRVMGWGELVMVISKTVEKRMIEDFGVPKEKIRLIYRGLDLEKYPYYPNKYDKEKETPIIINIGRITPIKGQLEFIKAMERVVNEKNRAEAWIVGGAEGAREFYLNDLKSLVKKSGLEKHVKFLGLRPDIQDLLKKADCLVLSSNVPEGFGRVIIEAGAVGTASCASDIGGVKEIIDDGTSGLLFPPGDDFKMAGAILKMLSDRELCKRCSRALRRKVEESFTLDKMAKDTLSVYEEVLKGPTIISH